MSARQLKRGRPWIIAPISGYVVSLPDVLMVSGGDLTFPLKKEGTFDLVHRQQYDS